jgi:hypothetical protein
MMGKKRFRPSILSGSPGTAFGTPDCGQRSAQEVGAVIRENPRCSVVNQKTSAKVREFCVFRRQKARPKIAAIAFIMDTCRRLDISLRDYLNDVLTRLGEWPANRVGEWTPTAWKTARAK